jgi:xanthine dehydrogenase accessory factor
MAGVNDTTNDTTVADLLDALLLSIAEAAPVALATVVDVRGASPARTGFKLLVHGDGHWLGNVGGGALEQRVREDAAAALADRKPRLAHYRLTEQGEDAAAALADGRPRLAHYNLTEAGPDALGMLCGGEVTVFIEPYLPKPVLLIVGGGHIGRPLAELARVLGYDVQVVDVRPDRGDRPRFDPAAVTASTYVVLITEDHVTDEAALRQALPTPAPYIGMIGSLRKVGIVIQHLRAEGATEDSLARVRAPIGLDTGGREPAEIALAILAEIECVRHGGHGRPRSLTPGKEPDSDQWPT